MNKYLLSLLLFGYLWTEKVYSQSEGSESSEGGTGTETDTDTSEGGSGGGSGGGIDVDPNYFIDRYTLENDSYVPNPYPLDMCVQTSIWDEDPSPVYAIYSCSGNGNTAFKDLYDTADCSGNSTDRKIFSEDEELEEGDLLTFYCDGDDYYINLGSDCGSSGGETQDYVSIVPFVCFRDSDSQIAVSNSWECDDDTKQLDFFIYSGGDEDCAGDGNIKVLNVTTECESDIWTTQISGLSEAVGLKLVGTSSSNFVCPSEETDTDDDGGESTEGTDDDDDTGDDNDDMGDDMDDGTDDVSTTGVSNTDGEEEDDSAFRLFNISNVLLIIATVLFANMQ